MQVEVSIMTTFCSDKYRISEEGDFSELERPGGSWRKEQWGLDEEEEEGGFAVGGMAGGKPGEWARRGVSPGQGQDTSHWTGCFTQGSGCKLAVCGPHRNHRYVVFGPQS